MSKSKSISARYVMVGGTFLLAMIVLFDRILISVAETAVSNDLSLSKEQMGWVMAVFALGYALFQIPAGFYADKLGARKLLTAVVALWSIFTALTGLAWNLLSMLVVRFLFGAGEAGAFPGISRAVYKWIPLKERGIVHGINFSGGRIGAAISFPIVAGLIEWTGWRMTFAILGLVGIAWAVLWYAFFRDDPQDHPAMSEHELQEIQEGMPQDIENAKKYVSFIQLFENRNIWLLMGQYFCSNFTFFFCLTWFFPLLKEKYSLEAVEAGFYSSAPLVFGAVGNWVSGWLVDFIYKAGRWELSRKLPAILGFVLAAGGILASIFMTEVTQTIICVSIAVFGADMTLSPSWSSCIDIGKDYSGTVSGTMNMAGNLGSFVTALSFPYLLGMTGSDTPFFYTAVCLNLLAILCWIFFQPKQELTLYAQHI